MNILQNLSTVASILSLLGLSGGALLYYRANRRRAMAEAKQAEVAVSAAETNNAILATNEWKDMAVELRAELKERETKIDELNTRIGSQFDTIGQWRDKYNKSQEELATLAVEKATKTPMVCEVRVCPKREPDSGY